MTCKSTHKNTKVGLYALSFALSSLGLQSCFLPPEVTGRVIDQSGEPLSNVRVWIQNSTFETLTNAQGFYELPYSPGSFTIYYSKPKYLEDTITINLASRTRHPAAEMRLIRVPDLEKAAMYGKGFYTELAPATLRLKSRDNNVDYPLYLVSDEAYTDGYYSEGTIITINTMDTLGIIEANGLMMGVYRVNESGLFYQTERNGLGSTIFGEKQFKEVEISQMRWNDDVSLITFPKGIETGIYLLVAKKDEGIALFTSMMAGSPPFGNPGYLFAIHAGSGVKPPTEFYPLQNFYEKTYESAREMADAAIEEEKWSEAISLLQQSTRVATSLYQENDGIIKEIQNRVNETFDAAVIKFTKKEDWEGLVDFASAVNLSETHEKTLREIKSAAEADSLQNRHNQRYGTKESSDATLGKAWHNRGNLYERAGMWNLAVRSWTNSVNSNPYNEDLLYRMAWSLVANGGIRNPSEGNLAIEWADLVANRVSDVGPFGFDLLRLYAAAYSKAGQHGEAINHQRRAISAWKLEKRDELQEEEVRAILATQISNEKVYEIRSSGLVFEGTFEDLNRKVENKIKDQKIPVSSILPGAWSFGRSTVVFKENGDYFEIDRERNTYGGTWTATTENSYSVKLSHRNGANVSPYTISVRLIFEHNDYIAVLITGERPIYIAGTRTKRLYPSATLQSTNLVGAWIEVPYTKHPHSNSKIQFEASGQANLDGFQFNGFEETVEWQLHGDSLIWSNYSGRKIGRKGKKRLVLW